MCTEKQIQANRANALRSTGPRTTTGKQKSSQNAVRHGLLSGSGQILIAGEDPTEYEAFCGNLREDLKPVGQLETLLAERITGFFWKLGRTGRMEKGLLDILCNPPTEKDPSKTNIKSQFMMIMTKQYKTPSEDPEFQEFKKHKEQQAAAINYTSDEGDLLEPETVEELTELQNESTSNSSASTDNASAQTLGRAVQYDFQNNSLLERLLKYEGQIERSLYKAMSQLQKLQYVRRSNKNLDSDMNIEEKSNEPNLEKTECAAKKLDNNPVSSRNIEVAKKPESLTQPPTEGTVASKKSNEPNLSQCAAEKPNNNLVSSRSIEVAADNPNKPNVPSCSPDFGNETAAQSPDSRADKHTNKPNLDKTEPGKKPDNPPVPPRSVEVAVGHTNEPNLDKTECAAKNLNNNPVSSRSIKVAVGYPPDLGNETAVQSPDSRADKHTTKANLDKTECTARKPDNPPVPPRSVEVANKPNVPQAPKTEELDHSLCPTHMVRRFVCGCRDESKIPKTADSICPRHAVRFRVCGCSYEPKVPKDGKSICPHHAVRYSLCGCK